MTAEVHIPAFDTWVALSASLDAWIDTGDSQASTNHAALSSPLHHQTLSSSLNRHLRVGWHTMPHIRRLRSEDGRPRQAGWPTRTRLSLPVDSWQRRSWSLSFSLRECLIAGKRLLLRLEGAVAAVLVGGVPATYRDSTASCLKRRHDGPLRVPRQARPQPLPGTGWQTKRLESIGAHVFACDQRRQPQHH